RQRTACRPRLRAPPSSAPRPPSRSHCTRPPARQPPRPAYTTLFRSAGSLPGSPTATSNVVTVTAPSLSMNGNGEWVGNQMHHSFRVYLSDAAPAARAAIILQSKNPTATSGAHTSALQAAYDYFCVLIHD